MLFRDVVLKDNVIFITEYGMCRVDKIVLKCILYFQAVSEFLLVVAVIYSFSMRCGITFYWVVLTHICLKHLVCHRN